MEKNAYEMSKRYLQEGLRDRSLTRDLDWGIDVPKEGYEGRKYTFGRKTCLDIFPCAIPYVFVSEWIFTNFGTVPCILRARKDNIPFHTLILPSLLFGVPTLR